MMDCYISLKTSKLYHKLIPAVISDLQARFSHWLKDGGFYTLAKLPEKKNNVTFLHVTLFT
jgi:hypothetical protein